jgi:hypothetical protein
MTSSLQGIAIAMCGGCALVVVAFFLTWAHYDPHSSTWGIPRSVADPLMIGYGPVVATTLLGFAKVLFRTFVAVGDGEPQPLIPVKRGVWVLYAFSFAGVVVALSVILGIAFHSIAATDAKYAAGIGASCWAGSTGIVFSRFFAQLAEEDVHASPRVGPAADRDPAGG